MASPEDAEDPLQLCVEILKDGYADAFIQFFSLSPRVQSMREKQSAPQFGHLLMCLNSSYIHSLLRGNAEINYLHLSHFSLALK